jgi:iron complex outermembrane receptor protein
MNRVNAAAIRSRSAGLSALCGALAATCLVPGVALAQTDETGGIEEIVVTAQRRETVLQTTPVAISAYTGESLAEDKVFTVTDLANSVPAFSLTAGTPLDVELNIRGVTNTRLDAPTADPSIGTFIDGVYHARSGDLNYDFYDLARVEVIRGPQGVLLGKNVVGGALSIITAKPKFDPSAKVLVSYGNYNSQLISGYATGRLTDKLAGRFSFQTRKHSGYARDILHDREVENLDAVQARAQLLYEPGDDGWTVRGIVDYNKDSTNGLNSVAVDGGTVNCEQTYLRTNCTRPWSNLRRYLGITNPRENVAQAIPYAGLRAPLQQFMKREGTGITLDIQKPLGSFSFNSLTNYRKGFGQQVYDQTGAGPEALGWDTARYAAFSAFVAATRPAGNTSNGAFLFAEPVGERAEVKAFSQEFRLTSNTEGKFEWIAGVYYKDDSIDKQDDFIGETFLSSVTTGPLANGLRTLSGQSQWINNGKNKSSAVFGQIAYKFTDGLKLSVGARYTEDKKSGVMVGNAIARGDRFLPTDTATLTPLSLPVGTNSYTQVYGQKWNKFTPQAILEWKQSDALFMYGTVARGFKGGGFEDTAATAAAAAQPYNPETVTNYEVGFKSNLLNRRIRLNATVFKMDYKDLQVTQTNAACLCNITQNAASANIKGVEAEFEFAVTPELRLSLSGSYVDPKYENFIETAINPSTGQRLVSTGNRLQRTPKEQISAGVDFTTSLGKWDDALNFHVAYSWQSDLFWNTDNIARQEPYGLLDVRVGLAPKDADWEVALYGKNVSDKLYRVNAIAFFGEEVSQFGAPRTYGIDLTWKF